MKSVWVISGSSGEYEDRRDWEVAVYSNKAEALRHFAAVQKAQKRIEREHSSWANDQDREYRFQISNPYDPRQDEVETRYSMYRLAVRDRFTKTRMKKGPVDQVKWAE